MDISEPSSATVRFRELIDGPEEQIDLAEAALLIAKNASHDLNVGRYLARIDQLAETLSRRLPEEQFFRSHRACLVRLDRIRTIEPVGTGAYELVLDHPASPRVPLARERVRSLRDRIPFAG